jgi:hypothetical protein
VHISQFAALSIWAIPYYVEYSVGSVLTETASINKFDDILHPFHRLVFTETFHIIGLTDIY